MSVFQTRLAQLRRQSIALAVVTALLAGCGAATQARLGGKGQGGVATDEPHAATVGRGVLDAGGSSADAAVATALALSVTFPVAASLGGGGACVVFDGSTGSAESLEFLPQTPRGGGAVAVPGMVRGLAALHARYGRLPWEDVVRPAEEMARSGHPLSRAMARNIGAAAEAIDRNDTLRRWLGREQGGLLEEGEGLVQIELSATLSLLRSRGGGDFYGGLSGRQFVDAARRLGGAVTLAELRAFTPTWGQTAQAKIGDTTLHTIPLPSAGAAIAGRVWLMLSDADRYYRAAPDERSHLVAEASLRAFADLRAALSTARPAFTAHALMQSYDPNRHQPIAADSLEPYATLPIVAGGDGTTGFVIGDNDGSAVACNLVLGTPFGIGAWDPITGIVPAPSAAIADARRFAGPILTVRTPDSHVVLAGAASGGVGAPVALAQAAVIAAANRGATSDALAAARVLHLGSPDMVIVEPELSKVATDGLAARNHVIFRAAPIGFVNLLHCPKGLGRGAGGCSYAADPRGSGLDLTQ